MTYRAVKRREHACCYEAVVEDMDKPITIGGEHYQDQHESICECWTMEMAEKIAAALNAAAGN